MKSARVLFLVLGFGCGRVADAQIELQTVVSGIDQPVYVTHARDGSNRLFVLEQPGAVRVLLPGESTPRLFLDIRSKVLAGGERGLLGLAFHPAYRETGRFFVNYTRQTDGATVISEYRAAPGNPNAADPSERVLLVIGQPFSNHNGGMLEFGPDGYLYIATGDGGAANDPGNHAQDPGDLLGKILRIDVDRGDPGQAYASPPSNPFVGVPNARPEVYALGLRNPWRFSFDRATGELYAGDVGQNQIEEIDRITRGGNYGWRIFEGTRCTGLGPASCEAAGFTGPIAEYAHEGARCSVTGGYAYRGSLGTLPAGAYVYGDFCSGEIFIHNGGSSSRLLDTGLNISSFGEDQGGEIYVAGLTDGTIYRITNPAASTGARVFFPFLASSGTERTGFAIVNLDAAPANLVLTAYDPSGGVISGTGTTNPRSLVLGGRQQLALVDSEIFGEGLLRSSASGWVRVDSSTDRLAAFFLNFAPSLRALDGAEASDTTLTSFVLPEIEAGGFTRIHIANPTPAPVPVTLRLWSGSGGLRSTALRDIPARGGLSGDIEDFFAGIARASSDYVSGEAAAGVSVFELLGVQGRDPRGLNGQNAALDNRTLYAPQYVAGGRVQSILTLVNLDDRQGLVTLSFSGKDGTPIVPARDITAGPRAKVVVDDPAFFGDFGADMVVGSLRVSSSSVRLAGSIQFKGPAQSRYSTSLPLVSLSRNRLVFSQVASDMTYFTGIALLNPGTAAANAQIQVFDASGTALASGPIRLGPGASESRLLTEYFPSLAGRTLNSGYIVVDADQPIAGFAAFGTTDLGVLSAIPAQVVPD